MNGLLPIIRRARRPLLPVDDVSLVTVEPPPPVPNVFRVESDSKAVRRSRVSSSPRFEEFVLSNFTANLLGYWKLGETVGAPTAADSSGRGINGAVTSVTFGQPGIPNSVLTCGQFGTGKRVRLEQTNTPPPLGTPRA